MKLIFFLFFSKKVFFNADVFQLRQKTQTFRDKHRPPVKKSFVDQTLREKMSLICQKTFNFIEETLFFVIKKRMR